MRPDATSPRWRRPPPAPLDDVSRLVTVGRAWCVVAVAVAAAACTSEVGEPQPARAGVTTATDECQDLREVLRSCLDGGWNRAECEADFQADAAALAAAPPCTPVVGCGALREAFEACLGAGAEAASCAEDFYRQRELNVLGSDCAPDA